ncbi:MAG: hypothetical protein ACRCS9_02845 [Hyphomicrobium sp.]
MVLTRIHRLRSLLAAFALLGAVLHVGLVPWHGLMRIAAAPASTSGDGLQQWAASIGAPVCRAMAGDPANGGGSGTTCPVCDAVLSTLSLCAPVGLFATPIDLDGVRIARIVVDVAPPQRAALFDARGPPRA